MGVLVRRLAPAWRDENDCELLRHDPFGASRARQGKARADGPGGGEVGAASHRGARGARRIPGMYVLRAALVIVALFIVALSSKFIVEHPAPRVHECSWQ